MFKFFATKAFWQYYIVLCAISVVLAILLSNIFDLGGKDFMQASNKDAYLVIYCLLLPPVFAPFFAIIAGIQKLKARSTVKNSM